MSLFKQFTHVSVTVTDVSKAREFYSDVLGFQEIARPAFNFPGIWALTKKPAGSTARSASSAVPTAVACGLFWGSATMSWPPMSSTGSPRNTPRSTSRSYSARLHRRTVNGA